LDSHRLVGSVGGSVERCLVLDGRHVVARSVEPLAVAPRDPSERRELEVIDRRAWSSRLHELSLVEVVHGLGQRIVRAVAGRSRRCDPKPLRDGRRGERDGRKLPLNREGVADLTRRALD
jgi:hypothetical protein